MNLRQLMQMRGWNQNELAKRCGLSPSHISHFISGSRKPALDNLVKLADALNVTVDAVLGRSRPSPVAESLIRATDSELLDEVSRRMVA